MSIVYDPGAGARAEHFLSQERDTAGGLSTWLVVAIAVAYLVPGLIGHDPWKQDEAYVFGGVLDMLKSGDWVVLKVGGIPFMEKPPLYHWVAALAATLFSPLLPLHDAARLASGVFMAATVGATAFAARLLWGRGYGNIGALLVLSPLGLQTNAQMMLTDLPLMTGFAVAVAGFAGCSRRRPWGGALLGLGVGIGFLGKGLLAPATLGIAAAALPFAFPSWRTRRYFRDLGVALIVAAPFLLVWPIVLWMRSPTLFMTWFWENNLGRYLGFSVAQLGAATESGYWTKTLPWFLFPLWVFVGAAMLRDRTRYFAQAGTQIGVAVAGCAALVLLTSASARSIYALPMVPALAVAAAGSVRALGERMERVLFALSVALGTVAMVLVWYGWGALVFTSQAPDWPWLVKHFPKAFSLPFSASAVLLAAMVTCGFAAICVKLHPSPRRALIAWVGACALMWGLPALLWLPWIDNGKSYRSMYESMARAIPAGVDCVASLGLGESERAVLEYVLDIPTRDPQQCNAVLRQGRTGRIAAPVPETWRLVWKGSRPGDHRERFELWLRPTATAPGTSNGGLHR